MPRHLPGTPIEPFEFDRGKVKADDQYGSAQLFRYQNNLDGFDGSVYAGTLQMETKLV